MQFDENILKQAYEEELRHFGIRSNGTNAIKQLLDQIGSREVTPVTQKQVTDRMNMFTTADIVAYCLQSYYDQRDEFDINESLYSSGIERTSAYFNDDPCLPAHNDELPKVEYIENVLFKCFSPYMITKGYRAMDIYRYMIRFGCILNPRSNIFVLLFNNLSNRYYLRSANLDEGSEHGFTDKNMFTGQRNVVNLSSRMQSQITRSDFLNVAGQPFMLTIDYGNIITLDARPYAYVLQALFYMRDNNVSDYEGTKIRIIQEAEEKAAEEQREEVQQGRNLLRKQLQQQQVTKNWLESRSLFGNQGGGRERRIKSKKYKKVKVNKKTHYSRNKSRRHRQRRKSKEKR